MQIIAYLMYGKIGMRGKGQYWTLPEFGRGEIIDEAKIWAMGFQNMTPKLICCISISFQ